MSDAWLAEFNRRQRVDRPWREYPLGTKAHAIGGGHWIRVERGWRWFCGNTFPTPGADAFEVTLPQEDTPKPAPSDAP